MTYAETVQYLYELRMFGAKLGLENVRRLADLAGNPQQSLRFIHVAGTNGKGSVCAMLESIYRQAGLRVGLFTSPHLVSFAERIQVNRALVPEREVVRLAGEIRQLVAGEWQPFETGHPTFFEVVTVMALRYFAEQKCDLVVWETGLGGRLDATNVVTPLASVITNIDFDHQQWLGDTLDQIASEKAGIIKPGVPVITGAVSGCGLEVIADAAGETGSPLVVVKPAEVDRWVPAEAEIPLAGAHQRYNAALAAATVTALQAKIAVDGATLLRGLQTVHWPGRMQSARLASGQMVLLDGAHNAASATALRDAITAEYPAHKPAIILGVLADKDWEPIASTLAPLGQRVLLVPVSSQRTLAPHELVGACRRANPATAPEVCRSLEHALALVEREPFVLITGSLYLAGEAIERLGLSPKPPTDERSLNEWGGALAQAARTK
jgi:dihydrofolate synthase/folylpolyglutamate synthase